MENISEETKAFNLNSGILSKGTKDTNSKNSPSPSAGERGLTRYHSKLALKKSYGEIEMELQEMTR